MGCCASTNRTSPPQNSPRISNSGDSKSPPPSYPSIEEETVKEVLSETPTITTFHKNHQNQSQFIKTVGSSGKTDERKHHPNGAILKKPFRAFGNDELSEVASTHFGSASVSTITETEENNGEEFHEIRRRSPARLRNHSFSAEVKKEKTAGKYPGRKSAHSPCRNGPGPGRGRRRESSERMPRSPAMRTGMGSVSATRKTGRVGFGSGERIRKVDEGKESGENTWLPTSNELLENPLVSLECFIFL
ncbi:hypothetical protein CDL12_23125 [Handroanthus impetiginosus]|uniref:Uncharacterized protein n=1 Tax=Handroanthus impetiginosus TaxID=429701 RepID=A0A2G9GGC5_9LAMI|nr:hypothetical protein CDL12_23125 [Handroanthus impetiginosus]